ncbi:MAG TPA: glycosyl hydrolase, partial [Planctomycetaceae bacterium]|nr:glycosyl hydrolase [Planctomycetaceae bacterium]
NDPDTIYSQWQYGGLVRYNRKSGERVDIKPRESKDGPPLRWNWDSALLISPHDSERIYYTSQMIFQSDDRGSSWRPISGDLTRQIDRNKLKVMGRVWGVDAVAKNASTSLYGTIVSIDESPRIEGLLYSGADDGMFQVSEDGGESWREVPTFEGCDVPEFGYINDIEADLHDDDTVYVAVNNHKRGDFRPYIVKSTDRGNTWKDISGNLPERGSVYAIQQDHENPDLLFCGTEFGCFFTPNGGEKWIELGSGLPTIAVRDIEIQSEADALVLATFGRGFYILDDYSMLRSLDAETKKSDQIFDVATGKMYRRITPLGSGSRGFQGANFYTASNPPLGVTIRYHLSESLRTKQSERKSSDAKLKAANKDVNYPSWEDLKAEDREVAPRRWIEIRDSSGNVVRKLSASSGKGMSSVVWDYRVSMGRRGGPVAIPGIYTASIHQMVDGEVSEVVAPKSFEIEPLMFDDTLEIDQVAIMDFCREASKLAEITSAAGQLLDEADEQLAAAERLVQSSPEVPATLWKDIRALQIQILDLNEVLSGDRTRARRNEDSMPGLLSRVNNAAFGALGSTEGPTETHREQLAIAAELYGEIEGDIRKVVYKDVPKLLKRIDELNAPWTPGRKLPEYSADEK